MRDLYNEKMIDRVIRDCEIIKKTIFPTSCCIPLDKLEIKIFLFSNIGIPCCKRNYVSRWRLFYVNCSVFNTRNSHDFKLGFANAIYSLKL